MTVQQASSEGNSNDKTGSHLVQAGHTLVIIRFTRVGILESYQHAQLAVPFYTTVAVLLSLSFPHKSRHTWRRGPYFSCLHQIALWAYLRNIFLIAKC